MKKITNKKLTKKYTDGRKYVGEFKDGKRHGQGTVIFADGRKYVGKWKDDKPNGKGILTFTDKKKYVGEYKNGKFTGRAICAKRGIELFFNKREHRFSSSDLRNRVKSS